METSATRTDSVEHNESLPTSSVRDEPSDTLSRTLAQVLTDNGSRSVGDGDNANPAEDVPSQNIGDASGGTEEGLKGSNQATEQSVETSGAGDSRQTSSSKKKPPKPKPNARKPRSTDTRINHDPTLASTDASSAPNAGPESVEQSRTSQPTAPSTRRKPAHKNPRPKEIQAGSAPDSTAGEETVDGEGNSTTGGTRDAATTHRAEGVSQREESNRQDSQNRPKQRQKPKAPPRKRKEVSTVASNEAQYAQAGWDEPDTADYNRTEDEGVESQPDGAQPTDRPKSARTAAQARRRKRKALVQSVAQPAAGSDNTQASDSGVQMETTTEEADGEGADDEAGTTGPRRKKRRRLQTPDDAEDYLIDTDTVTMFELCQDQKRGKKSKLEKEMSNIDWTEVVRRRKEADAKARDAGQNASRDEARRQLDEAGEHDQQRAAPSGPQLKEVDGQIVVDTASLVVNRHAVPDQAEPAVEENDLTKRINSATWRFDNKRDPADRVYTHSSGWAHDETDVFYGALKMFGTDFDMISKMFPGRTRRMIKNKFVREERDHEWRIRAVLLGQPDPINFENFLKHTGQSAEDFKDPKALEAELKEDEERQREEIEREREEQVEAQKRKQEAAQAKAEAAARRRSGEKVPRKRRQKKAKPVEQMVIDVDGEANGDGEQQGDDGGRQNMNGDEQPVQDTENPGSTENQAQEGVPERGEEAVQEENEPEAATTKTRAGKSRPRQKAVPKKPTRRPPVGKATSKAKQRPKIGADEGAEPASGNGQGVMESIET